MRVRSSTILAIVAILAGASMSHAAEDKKMPLDGTWLPATAELGGQAFPEQVRKSIKLELKGDQYTVTLGPTVDKGTCTLHPDTTPKGIDIKGTEGPNKGRTILAIYEQDGDTLRLCYDLSGQSRPTEFVSKPGTQLFLVTYKRDAR